MHKNSKLKVVIVLSLLTFITFLLTKSLVILYADIKVKVYHNSE